MTSPGEKSDAILLPAPVVATPTDTNAKPVFRTVACILLNCIATIAVVFLSKITFSDPQLRHCQISTSLYHFLMSFTLLYVSSAPNQSYYKPMFTRRWLPIRHIMPICILFAAFLVLGNLSLTFNPVSFFQLAKILTVPTVVLFNFVLLRKTTPTAKCVAVGVACIGVAMATGSSASSNLVGTAFAVASFCSTALYQITIGKMLSTPLDGEEVTAPQLLMNQTLLSSGLLVVLIPFFDTMPDWGTVPTQAIVTMLASGFVAAIINLTQFLIIGSTSVLAFNVVGIMKTVVTLLLAWWTEGKVVGARDAVGVLLAIGGSFAYAQIKT